ncbi:hypothetical protein BDV24DRAFT_166910 [Aspergillus arachidicola]|uniref:Uncharacterized protein n=1 Tax=Aspergillus arachidicola TaxID=656916 RepID=A0A5N6XZR4_9EURO|nr:hypothetical protein BDV24DRAFT_166910 [Aspergillus arachidicola]
MSSLTTTTIATAARASATAEAQPSLITNGDESKIRTRVVTPQDWVHPKDFEFPSAMVEARKRSPCSPSTPTKDKVSL